MTPDITLPNQLPGGVFLGTFSHQREVWTRPAEILVSEDGRVRVSASTEVYLPGKTGIELVGAFDMTGNTFAGDGLYFDESPAVWQGSPLSDVVVITGLVAERGFIFGEWAAGNGDTGCFEGTYDSFTYNTWPVDMLAKRWTPLYASVASPVFLEVDTEGRISGQDAVGCTVTGSMTLADELFGLYDVQVEATDCELAGSYQGFAYLCPCGMPETYLLMSLDNVERAVRYAYFAY